jgi:surface carbohydrate biosynthesis protein
MIREFGIVLIIVERAEREFLPKLMWKRELDSQGFYCLLAHRKFSRLVIRFLNFFKLKIILIDKSCQYYHLEYLSKLKAAGNYIIVAEEESWVPFDVEDYFYRRLPSAVEKIVDELWIPNNSLIKSYIPNAYKCYHIDHPRTVHTHEQYNHFTKKELDSEGRTTVNYILFISSFGLLSEDVDFMKVMANEGEPKKFNLLKYTQIYNELLVRFDHFVDVINALASHSQSIKIIIRPHPAEIGLWQKIKISPEISLDSKDYIESISNADLIVHSGSTVAFDVPEEHKNKVIYIAPIGSTLYEFPKVASGSILEMDAFTTAENLIIKIKEIKKQIKIINKLNYFIPQTDILKKSKINSIFEIILINIFLKLASVILSVEFLFTYSNGKRESLKIKEFKKLNYKIFKNKGNYHV